MKETILICDSVKFYSFKDEDAFFEWIKKIDCIVETSAELKKLYLHIDTAKMDDTNLDDLIGLFYRYKIDMKQLAQFLTRKNKEWFYDKKAFWFKKVFGQTLPPKAKEQKTI